MLLKIAPPLGLSPLAEWQEEVLPAEEEEEKEGEEEDTGGDLWGPSTAHKQCPQWPVIAKFH